MKLSFIYCSLSLSLSDQNLYLYLSFSFLFGFGFRERDGGCWVWLGLLGFGLSLRLWSVIVGGFDWVWSDLGLEKEMLVGFGFDWVRWLGLQGLLLLLVWSVIISRHFVFGVCWRFGFGICWEFRILKFLFVF